ncbi:MAG TPA: phytoene/squalene synthase family protein [Sphingomonas sp.]|nr:phytoene/squalene synthase family protein [Sphingomonas sp.]
MTPTRDAIVATAHESIARGSKSFALASRLLDRRTRERAWLLYAWCRRCDDLADGQDHGGALEDVADAQARLALIAARTEAALAGETVGDPAFDALRLVVAETGIPTDDPHDLVAGLALDAQGWRPRTEDDLMRYCHHVAGVVGRMMAIVMGVDPADEATLARADAMGRAFQLSNIMRDVEEDDRAGRCYLPIEWLAEMDIPPGEHMKPWFRERLVVLVRRLGDRAAELEAHARPGVRALALRPAWGVLTAAGIYGEIGRKVMARGEHAWDHRVTTRMSEKLGWVARGLGAALRRQRA